MSNASEPLQEVFMSIAWLYLALAVVFEVCFALSMKAAKGFTVLWPSVATLVGIVGGMYFLALALKTLPVSIGYPMWVGAGALGTVLFGFVLFGESLTLLKLASVAAILLGVIGLKIAAPS
jgi:quaternary ammonium compound-resistance protein SugE